MSVGNFKLTLVVTLLVVMESTSSRFSFNKEKETESAIKQGEIFDQMRGIDEKVSQLEGNLFKFKSDLDSTIGSLKGLVDSPITKSMAYKLDVNSIKYLI